MSKFEFASSPEWLDMDRLAWNEKGVSVIPDNDSDHGGGVCTERGDIRCQHAVDDIPNYRIWKGVG